MNVSNFNIKIDTFKDIIKPSLTGDDKPILFSDFLNKVKGNLFDTNIYPKLAEINNSKIDDILSNYLLKRACCLRDIDKKGDFYDQKTIDFQYYDNIKKELKNIPITYNNLNSSCNINNKIYNP